MLALSSYNITMVLLYLDSEDSCRCRPQTPKVHTRRTRSTGAHYPERGAWRNKNIRISSSKKEGRRKISTVHCTPVMLNVDRRAVYAMSAHSLHFVLVFEWTHMKIAKVRRTQTTTTTTTAMIKTCRAESNWMNDHPDAVPFSTCAFASRNR